MRLSGKRAIVTGASRGIGLGYAEVLAREGCEVVLNHFGDAERAAAAVSRLQAENGGRRCAHGVEADLACPEAARALVAEAVRLMGGIDILVSNAGICRFMKFLDLTEEIWERHVAVNFSAGFHVGQAAAQQMVRQGTGGRIVFTTSVGAVRSNPTQAHYCATKGGLELLAKGMALELAPHGINVNCIAPGWIHTDINDTESRDVASVKAWLAANCAVGRLGKPADVQSALLFLCAPESGYVNGATVHVDGGWNAQL